MSTKRGRTAYVRGSQVMRHGRPLQVDGMDLQTQCSGHTPTTRPHFDLQGQDVTLPDGLASPEAGCSPKTLPSSTHLQLTPPFIHSPTNSIHSTLPRLALTPPHPIPSHPQPTCHPPSTRSGEPPHF
eukprot:365100-Chlamydomonas_euryale.AAC.5